MRGTELRVESVTAIIAPFILLPEAFEEQLRSWAKADPEGAEIEKRKPRRRKLEFRNTDLPDEKRIEVENNMLKEIAQAMKKKSSN